jgi:hypothetical protein
MNFLMHEAMNWCRQNRPGLEASMTASRFRQLMNASTEATLGMSSARVWGDQAAFLESEESAPYLSTLVAGIDAYKQSL